MQKNLLEGRLLGGGEINTWFLDKAGCQNFCMVAELGGIIPAADILQQAAAAVAAAHPLLGCIILTDPLRLEHAGIVPQVAIAEGDWRPRVRWHTNTHFEESKELVRYELVQGDDGSAHLLVSFHHAISDGMSGITVLRDLLAVLNGASLPAATALPKAIEDYFPARARGWSGAWLFVRTVLAMLRGALAIGGRFRRFVPDAPLPSDRTSDFVELDLDVPTSRALAEATHRQGCTVHGLILAALAQATERQLEARNGGIIQLGSPVNMRPHVQAAIADQVQFGVSLASCVVPGRSQNIWHNACRISADTRTFIQNGGSLAFGMALAVLSRQTWAFPANARGIARMKKLSFLLMRTSATGLTNLGKVTLQGRTEDRYRCTRVRLVVNPGVVASIVGTAVWHQDQLSIVVCANAPQVTRAHLQEIAGGLQQILTEVSA